MRKRTLTLISWNFGGELVRRYEEHDYRRPVERVTVRKVECRIFSKGGLISKRPTGVVEFLLDGVLGGGFHLTDSRSPLRDFLKEKLVDLGFRAENYRTFSTRFYSVPGEHLTITAVKHCIEIFCRLKIDVREAPTIVQQTQVYEQGGGRFGDQDQFVDLGEKIWCEVTDSTPHQGFFRLW